IGMLHLAGLEPAAHQWRCPGSGHPGAAPEDDIIRVHDLFQRASGRHQAVFQLFHGGPAAMCVLGEQVLLEARLPRTETHGRTPLVSASQEMNWGALRTATVQEGGLEGPFDLHYRLVRREIVLRARVATSLSAAVKRNCQPRRLK